MKVTVPMRTDRGQNGSHGHWASRNKRAKQEIETVQWHLTTHFRRMCPQPPCSVTLTRVAPSSGLDDDNLRGSLKHVRDAVARWLRVDDGDRALVRFVYRKRRGPWGVDIEFEPMGRDDMQQFGTPGEDH